MRGRCPRRGRKRRGPKASEMLRVFEPKRGNISKRTTLLLISPLRGQLPLKGKPRALRRPPLATYRILSSDHNAAPRGLVRAIVSKRCTKLNDRLREPVWAWYDRFDGKGGRPWSGFFELIGRLFRMICKRCQTCRGREIFGVLYIPDGAGRAREDRERGGIIVLGGRRVQPAVQQRLRRNLWM